MISLQVLTKTKQNRALEYIKICGPQCQKQPQKVTANLNLTCKNT